MADPGGHCWHVPPYGSRFFRFDIQIFQNVAASGVGAPPMRSVPPYGKSWICYCVIYHMAAYSIHQEEQIPEKFCAYLNFWPWRHYGKSTQTQDGSTWQHVGRSDINSFTIILVFRKFCFTTKLDGIVNNHNGYFSSEISAQQEK